MEDRELEPAEVGVSGLLGAQDGAEGDEPLGPFGTLNTSDLNSIYLYSFGTSFDLNSNIFELFGLFAPCV